MITNPTALAVVGDWHMNGYWGKRIIRSACEGEGVQVFVHTGDFGYTFDKQFMLAIQRVLEEFNAELIFTDGNHEDHARLAEVLKREPREDGTYTVSKYASRIRYAPRGYVTTFWGQKWLFVGGAYSVDRAHRVQGRSWWEGETLSYAEIARIMGEVEDQDIDVMVSHDAPNGVTVPGTHHGAEFFGMTNIATAEQHRAEFSNIVDVAAPKVVFHGHFHVRYAALRNNVLTAKHAGNPDPKRDLTVVRGLDCDGSSYADNVVVIREGDIDKAYTDALAQFRP